MSNGSGIEGELPSFGGKPLGEIAELPPAAVSSLQALGFDDAEQVIAAIAVPDVDEEMRSVITFSGAAYDDVVETLRGYVPAMAALSDEETPSLGALAPTDEIETLIGERAEAQMAADDELPPSVSHVAKMPSVKNQGARGTCVSFAMTVVHEYYRRLSGAAEVDYSEQFLYHETKLIDGQPTVCGTWQVKAAQVLGSLGQCPEAVWPYNGNPPCNNNGVEPATARPSAAGHKLATVILQPRNIQAIKTALFYGSVVGFSVPVYNSWFQSQETKRTGRITMRIGNEPAAGGHAMCLIGYQDSPAAPGGGFFILRNSWFGTWATDSPYGSGNGTIPYAYISSYNWEAVTTPPPPGYTS